MSERFEDFDALLSDERVREAVNFLEGLKRNEIGVGEEQIAAAERRLMEAIRRAESGRARIIKIRWRAVAAAALVIVSAGGYGLYTGLQTRSAIKTGFGEVREQVLPDGTEVMINANSHISYKDREVWLSGEAFFHVRRTSPGSRFIVHTAHFDITVLGTSFNAVSRRGEDNVMLKEGRIKLHTAEGKEVYMRPGEFIAYRPERLEKKTLKTDSIIAWKDHKLVFNNTPLREVAKIIEEHYGVKVTLADPATERKSLCGVMDNDNLDLLLEAMGMTGEFGIVRDDKGITIHSKL